MALDQQDVDYGRSKARNTYFKKSTLAPGTSVTVRIVDAEKNKAPKFPIEGETFCYRFILDDGRVWDEASPSVFGSLIKILHPDGKTFTPADVKLTKLATKPLRGSQYTVEKA